MIGGGTRVMTLVLSAADVAASLPPISDQVDLVSATLVAGERHADSPRVPVHPRRGAVVEAVATWLPADNSILGAAWMGDFPANSSVGLPRKGGLILVNDADSGALLGIVDAAEIVTAVGVATSVAAVRRFSAGARTIALIGAGADARAHLSAFATLGIGNSARVFDQDATRAERLCAWASRSLSFQTEPARSVVEAVAGAELVVSCASGIAHAQSLHPIDVDAAGLIVSVGRDAHVSAEVVRTNRWFVVDDSAQLTVALQQQLTEFPNPDESLGEALATATSRPVRVAFLGFGVSPCQVALAGAAVRIAEEAGRGVQVT